MRPLSEPDAVAVPRAVPGPRLAVFAWCALAVSAALILFLSLSAARSSGAAVDAADRQAMRSIVSLARNLLEPTLSQVRSGQLSPEAAREQARSAIRLLTYADADGVNYVFMYSSDGTVLVLPFDPSKEGTSQQDLQDSRGNYILRILKDAALKSPDGGFASYYYSPPGRSVPEEKTSFALYVKEIDAVIGTGMFLRRGEKAPRTLVPLLVGAGLLAAALPAAAVLLLLRTLSGLTSLLAAERAKSANFEGAFSLLDSGFAVFCVSGTCLWTNETAARLFGLPDGARKGVSFGGLLRSGGGASDAALLFERALSGEIVHAELALGGPEGRTAETEAFIRRGSWNGEPAVVAEIREIGEQRRLERALYARKAELDRFERLVVGRELRMIELKKRIQELEGRIEGLAWSGGKGGPHG